MTSNKCTTVSNTNTKIKLGDVVQQMLVPLSPFKKYSGTPMTVLGILPEGCRTSYSVVEGLIFPFDILLTSDDVRSMSTKFQCNIELWKETTEESRIEMWNELMELRSNKAP